MIDKTDKILHFLSNLLTILSIDISDSSISVSEKNQSLNIIRVITLLTVHGNIFLGEKSSFFKRDVSLLSIFDILRHSSDVKFDFIISKSNVVINIDKGFFLEALRDVLKYLSVFASKIELEYNKQKKILSIIHNAKDVDELKAKDPMQCLRLENISNAMIPYQVALKALDMHGSGIKIMPGRIFIYL